MDKLAILAAFLLVAYVGASIARDVYWDLHTRPPKSTDKEGKKVLTRKINTVKERIQ